jgi:hypothetical protein
MMHGSMNVSKDTNWKSTILIYEYRYNTVKHNLWRSG